MPAIMFQFLSDTQRMFAFSAAHCLSSKEALENGVQIQMRLHGHNSMDDWLAPFLSLCSFVLWPDFRNFMQRPEIFWKQYVLPL